MFPDYGFPFRSALIRNAGKRRRLRSYLFWITFLSFLVWLCMRGLS